MLTLLARAVMIAVALTIVLLAIGLVLVLFGKFGGIYGGSSVVRGIEDAARAVAGPFDGLFTFGAEGSRDALNWGIAGVVYFVVAKVIATLLRALAARLAPGAPAARGA